MKKTIQIILKKTDSRLGSKNDIKLVALGYAFNYLIPQQIAKIATKGEIQHINMLNNSRSKKEKLIHVDNINIKNNLQRITKINIRKKIGKNKQIFGSITENEIAEIIEILTQKSISKQNIELPYIKKIGIYTIKISISNTIEARIVLHILPLTI